MEQLPGPPSRKHLWLATIAVIVVVLAAWKIIDYRLQPPPPPSAAAPAAQP